MFVLAGTLLAVAAAPDPRDSVHGVRPVKPIPESMDLLVTHMRRTQGWDFKDTPFYPKEGRELVTFEEAGGKWSGKEDHSSAFSFGWEKDRLLVVAHVVDDEHVHSGGGGYNFVWDGDSLQLLITDADRTEVTAMYNVALYDDRTVHVQYEQVPEGVELDEHGEPVSGIVAHVERDTDTFETTYKVSIPVHMLGLPPTAAGAAVSQLKEGVVFGIALCVNDGDIPPSEQGQRGWSGLNPDAIVYEKEPKKAQLLVLDHNSKKKKQKQQKQKQQRQKQQKQQQQPAAAGSAQKTEL